MTEPAIARRTGPALIINVGVAIGLVVTIALIVWAQQLPALPFALEVVDDRVVVEDSARVVTRLAADAPGAIPFPIVAADLVEEPDVVNTWDELDAFYARQAELHARLSAATVRVEIDGAWQTVPVERRGLAHLPFAFYTLLVAALVAWVVGFATYSFSDRGPAAQIYVFSAVAFCVAVWPAALYAARPIALDAPTFRALSTTDHAGALLFAAGLIGVLAVYPVRLMRSIAVLWITAIVAAVVGHLQLGDKAISGFYTANATQFLAFLGFAVWQWRRSRKDPLQRAALGWILLSMFIGVIFFFTFITLPVLLGTTPVITQTTGLVSIVVVYVGISLGVLRFRLFDLDRWWFRTWSWILGGMAVVGVDLLLSRLFDIRQNVALVVAVVVIGWVYFPIRQKLFARLGRAGRPASEYDTRELIIATTTHELRTRFAAALTAVFSPLEIVESTDAMSAPRLAGDGAWLEVPAPTRDGAFRCHFRDRGARLFGRDDVDRANELLQLGESVRLAISAREDGELAERNRIRRDLHDDLGASIIRIAHEAGDERTVGLAKAAMSDLRDVLTALQDAPIACRDVLDEVEADLRLRAHADGRELAWTITGETDSILSARVRANLTRVFREAMTNALKHGVGEVRCTLDLGPTALRIAIANGATGDGPIEPGMGIENITARMLELGGAASYTHLAGTFELAITLPWSTES